MTAATRQAPVARGAARGGAARETRGRLKIFLGAAPGVGKTYEMLAGGARQARRRRRRRRRGRDPRPRRDPGAARGLEVIPRRRDRLQGPDARGDGPRRHPRAPARSWRWSTSSPTPTRPAAAIPSATWTSRSCSPPGIDVYTTLNIQHLESLNDVVAQITRVRVRETVPDSIIDRADDIEVDRPHARRPDPAPQGGQGLRPARQAERALNHYFSPGNLTALRELALRGTARSASTSSCSPTCRRTPSPAPGRPASACWSASARTRAPPAWCATPSAWPTGCTRPGPRSTSRRRAAQLSEDERDRIADTLRLAERLGGEASPCRGGRSIADDVLWRTPPNNVTQIVIGKSTRSRWFEILHGSVVHDLVRPVRRHQRPRHRRRRGRAPTRSRRRRAHGGPAGVRSGPYAVALLAVAPPSRSASSSSRWSGSRTSTSCS